MSIGVNFILNKTNAFANLSSHMFMVALSFPLAQGHIIVSLHTEITLTVGFIHFDFVYVGFIYLLCLILFFFLFWSWF